MLNSIWYIVKSLVIDSEHDTNYLNNKLNLNAVLVLGISPKMCYVVKEIDEWLEG